MKRKILSVLLTLVLVLSFGLVTAVPTAVSANGTNHTLAGDTIGVSSGTQYDTQTPEAFNAEPHTTVVDDVALDAQTSPVTIEGEVSALTLGIGWPNTAYVEIGLSPAGATMTDRNAGVYLIAFNVAGGGTRIHLQDYTGNGNEGGEGDYAAVIDIPTQNSAFRYKITLAPSGDIGGTATLEVWVGDASSGTTTLAYGCASTWQEDVAGEPNEDFSDAHLFYSIIAECRGAPSVPYSATVGDITIDDTLHVGAGQEFTIIQGAINAAVPGHTINVAVGTYNENVVINKQLTVQGVDRDTTIINGTVTTAANDVTFTGFTVTGMLQAGDMSAWYSGVVISNNILKTIHGAACHGLVIENNTISGDASQGIFLDACDNTIIAGNTITGFENGPHEMDSHGFTGAAVFVYSRCDGTEITNNDLQDNSVGVYLATVTTMDTPANVKVHSNNIEGNGDYGVCNFRFPPGLKDPETGENLNYWDYDSFSPANNDIDVTLNWWGDASGPAPTGDGDAASENVDFFPWALDEARTQFTNDATDAIVVDGAWAGDSAYTQVIVDDIDYYVGVNAFAIIQDGITGVASGGTVNVAAGTYNERVNINKSLTLEGVNAGVLATGVRGPESIIDPQGLDLDFGVLIDGADTIATIDGFTVRNYLRGGILAGAFSLENDPIVVHILNNIVTQPIGQHNNNCIQVGDGTTGTVIGNEVMGANLESPDWSGSGILVAGSSDVLVSNNYVHDCEGGIQITGYLEYHDAPAEDNVIEYNLVEDNESGIVPQMYSMGTIIRYNDVLNNDEGIAVMAIDYSWEHSTPTGTEIYFNNVVGNEYGVKSGLWGSDTGEVLAEEVNANNNWWGHASGPIPPGTHTSYGDKVSGDVLYSPWLLAEVTPEVEPTTYDKTLALKDGWTLISVDKAVADSAWVGTEPLAKGLEETIAALKYGLVPAIGKLAFGPATTTDLEPLTSIYVKTNGGGGVGFNYAEEGPAFYSKDLEAGWNLISAPSSNIQANALLAQLRYVTVGTQQIVGLTTLVSQGDYNQFSGSFYLATLTDENWDALKGLELFDGYWAYMEAADTFEVPQ